MVKNRNWETRTEIAESRRMATRQRKQRRDIKKVAKSMMYDFFNVVDRHSDAIQRQSVEGACTTIHIWTDTEPADGPSLEEILLFQRYANEEQKLVQRRRSSSFNESPKSSKGKTRRSSSFGETGKKGRKSSIDEQKDDKPRLCRNHFFNGECERLQPKNGYCNHVHYQSDVCLSLARVLQSDVSSSETLEMSLRAAIAGEALVDATVDREDGGMEMVYYFSVPLFDSTTCGERQERVSEAISKNLLSKSCSLGSVVYVAVGKVLVFDRYRDGLIMSDTNFAVSVLGDTSRRARCASLESQGEGYQTSSSDENDDDGNHELLLLPAPLLEHVLTFLPEASVPAMSCVCQAWSREIGTSSPSLWRHLLQRRNFPLPAESAISEENARDVYRNEFIKHHSVMRNMKAIQTASSALTGLSGRPIGNDEFAMQSFSTRRAAPQEPNACVGVKIWSPQRVLAAYEQDCSLRLFEAVAKTLSESGESGLRSCREVVCVRMAKNSRRQSWGLLAVDLDEEMIGCLCEARTAEKDSYVLTVVGREDFLCSNGHVEDGTAHTIDIGEAVINYLLCCDEGDHNDIRFLNCSSISVSRGLVACGYGRFMVEVSLATESMDEDGLLVVDRKLVLVSASAGGIVWLGSLFPTQISEGSIEDMTLARAPLCATRGGITTCTLVAILISSTFKETVMIEIDSTNNITHRRPSETISNVIDEVRADQDLAFRDAELYPVTVTSADIVFAHNMYLETPERTEGKAFLSFYPYAVAATASDTPCSKLELEGICRVLRMDCIGEEHVVVLGLVSERMGMFDPEIEDASEQDSLYASVVHIPTRQQLARIPLLRNPGVHIYSTPGYQIPFFIAASGETVGVALWWKGIVLTGQNIRSVGENDTTRGDDERNNITKKRKKKKKRQATWGNKKDAFVRGISLSG